MVAIYTAHTAPVNPPGATPVLTVEQIWEALKIKAKNPLPFLPVVAKCEVVKETSNGLRRKVTFKPEFAGPGGADETEDIIFRAPYAAEFTTQSNGTVVQNIISHGPSSSPTDHLLTFAFNFQRPDLAEGSKEAQEFAERMKTTGLSAVNHTIEVARELVAKGEIKSV